MRIVHLTWGFGVGGSETLICDVAMGQAAEHEVCVVACNRDIDPAAARRIAASVRLIILGRPPGSANPWYLFKLILCLWRLRPQIVHAHQQSFSLLRRLIGAPMLLTLHNTRLHLGRGLAAFDAICCISEAVRVDVESRAPGHRLTVIPNGVKFNQLRHKSRYGGRPFRIVQVGRLDHAQKGQDLLIRSLPALLESSQAGNVQVDFIGEGASLGYLQRLAIDCGVDDRCRFLGALGREAIYEALREYDLLVQPSRFEGFGLTVIEGIAAGLPVLVSDIEGPMEIISNGPLGWCFRSEDTADLSAKLIELVTLSAQPGFADLLLGRLERARSRYDIKVTVRRYLDEYATLAAATAPLGMKG